MAEIESKLAAIRPTNTHTGRPLGSAEFIQYLEKALQKRGPREKIVARSPLLRHYGHVDAPDFEQAALRACELIIARDRRIGKVPRSRKQSKKN